LIPDEPLILENEVVPSRYRKEIPPAVRGWCLVAIASNCAVAAIATAIFRNGAPLLVGAIFTLFPAYMLLFWSDLTSTVGTVKQRAIERSKFAIRINLSIQWAAISICVTAPVMLSIVFATLWFIQTRR
jgi:hypothetical protein